MNAMSEKQMNLSLVGPRIGKREVMHRRDVAWKRLRQKFIKDLEALRSSLH